MTNFSITSTTFLDHATIMDAINHPESDSDSDLDDSEWEDNEDNSLYAEALLKLRNTTLDDFAETSLNTMAPPDPSLNPPPAKITHPEISNSLRSKIRSLRHLAGWPYRKIATVTKVAVATVHRICSLPESPRKPRVGRAPLLGAIQREKLIKIATSSAENRRKSLHEIAYMAGINASDRTLRRAMADAGYHRRIARQKPFLTPVAKTNRLNWAINYADWTANDWSRVIFSDESAFNVGGAPGNLWVTRRPGEEFNEDCLVPKFRKLDTIMVWACIIGGKKGPLVIWDRKEWGKTITAKGYCEFIIRPHLFPFWQAISRERGGYVYFMQDGAAPHRAKHTSNMLEELGIGGYVFPWAASSPDANIIEHCWLRMKESINRMTPRPTTNSAMKEAILAAWDLITDEDISALVETMPARVQAILTANGGCTRY